MNEELFGWASQLLEKLLTKRPDLHIVLLASGIDSDEHTDFPFKAHDRIHPIAPWCTTTNNLAVQAAVLSKATAFIGTYGGTMQLTVRMKIPAMGFYTKFEGTCYAHKLLTEYLSVQDKTSVFIGRPCDADFVHQALG